MTRPACARATRPRRTGQTAAFSARTSARASVNSRRTVAIARHQAAELAYVYFEDEAGRRSSANLLTRNGADRSEYRQAAGAVT
jgi:hypothetical protein